MSRLYSSLLLSLLIASSASAVTMEWTLIGNPANPCDPQTDPRGNPVCFGAVDHDYRIATYEVTNAQYAEFLNAKAASDPYGLFNPSMANPSAGYDGYGGIARTGTSGTYSYAPIAGREDMPVNHVSFYDTIRFVNWLSNGQGSGDTETGAYTLLGGTTTPSNSSTITRNAGATIFLPSEDEWYKAAYYDSSSGYFDYTTRSNAIPTCTAPTGAANSANCDAGQPYGSGDDGTDADVDDLTAVGSFTGAASPSGTFDQGGNVYEWIETLWCCIPAQESRVIRGGSFYHLGNLLNGSAGEGGPPSDESPAIGFRIAMIPEPSTGLLVIAGLLGLAVRRGATSA